MVFLGFAWANPQHMWLFTTSVAWIGGSHPLHMNSATSQQKLWLAEVTGALFKEFLEVLAVLATLVVASRGTDYEPL